MERHPSRSHSSASLLPLNAWGNRRTSRMLCPSLPDPMVDGSTRRCFAQTAASHKKPAPRACSHHIHAGLKNIIVITGASSGFGALAARALAKAGHTVYASMRDTAGRNAAQVDEAKRFSSENNVDLRTIELDVLSEESVNTAIQKIVADNGRLDVVVHNAGHMVFGPAEAFT